MKTHLVSEIGFTLIELLVVIAIIGILSAISVANFQEYKKRARDTVRVSDMHNIRTALEVYFVDNENYPGTPQGVSYSGQRINNSGTAIQTILSGIMGTVPVDPINDATHYYAYDPDHCMASGPNSALLGFITAESGKIFRKDTYCGADQDLDTADYNIAMFPAAP